MSTSIMPEPRQRYYNNNGSVASGCKLFTYAAGTTTPKATYTDAAGLIPHTNPITLDTKGEAVIYWDGAYKVDLKTAAGVQITGYPVDNYNTDPAGVWNTFTTLLGSAGSSLIGFIQDGAGAILRTLQGKGRDIVSVRDFTGETVDGLTSNQDGIVDAVAHAYAIGGALFWPAGSYVSTATIPNFHDIAHSGPGLLLRGADTFRIAGRSGTNTIYVATTGSDSNDGLTAAAPKLTVQGAFTALQNWSAALLTNGNFKIQLAAGSYSARSYLVGLRSKNRIIIAGPSVGGHPNVPTAIIEGFGVADYVGMYLQSGIYADVRDLKFQNWTYGTTAAFGFVIDGQCDAVLTNVHAYNCYYAGVSADNLSILRTQGGLIDACTFFGVRVYSQSSASIGYSGAAVGDSTAISNCNTGIFGAVSCRLHVDYAKLNNNSVGLYVEKNTRTVANYVLFLSNSVAVRYDQNSVYGESGGGTNTFTANGKDYVSYGSEDDISSFQRYWDRTTQRTLYGATSYRSLTAKWEWQLDAAASGSSYNSAVKAIFDSNFATAYIGMSAPVTSEYGFLWTSVAKPAQGKLSYVYSDDSMRVGINGLTTGYRFTSAKFGPDQDNSKTLGEASFRWSVVYAGTGAINTSDAREKEQIQDIDEAAIRAVSKISFKKFKFRDAVALKGADARWHFGVIAQEVQEAFESEGLDAFAYGLLCYDEWPEQLEQRDEDGNITQEYQAAGNRYGVRENELTNLVLASLL